jgi:hypothetical protein
MPEGIDQGQESESGNGPLRVAPAKPAGRSDLQEADGRPATTCTCLSGRQRLGQVHGLL